jgi:protein gp37
MNKTKVEWCDYTWNPVTGCSEVSEGCYHCYAKELSRRFGWHWGYPVLHRDRLDQPQQIQKPGKVFVCSMGDLGHPGVYPRWLQMVIDAMRAAPWHTYIVLTKRPGHWISNLPASCWVGVSVEMSKYLPERVRVLDYHAGDRLRVLSLEPLLEEINLAYELFNGVDSFASLPGIDWVIAGPETGRRARPCDDKWIDAIAYDCERAQVPFFDKRKTNWLRREWPTTTNKETTYE